MLTNIKVDVQVNEKQAINLTHISIDVGVESTIVLPENANRKYVLLANNSDTDMYISLNGIATVGQGIPINAGGNYQMSLDYITTAEIQAIHQGAGLKKLLVTEGI